MDMIFQRYACPYELMDGMIASCRFNEWISEIVNLHNDEEVEKAQWEFFLHKVFDMSYEQYKEDCKLNQQRQVADQEFDFEATFNNSKNMLEGFVPE